MFPNDPGYVVPLVIALKRGLRLSEIDFVLGGSSLEALANQQINGDDRGNYLVQRVKHVIFFVKHKLYVQHYADTGFQFERILTGGKASGIHDSVRHDNLRVLKLGPYTVLFSADVDAVDSQGRCVEIKSGNPNYFGTRVMLQMLSSGAEVLAYANKRGNALYGIEKCNIAELVAEHSAEDLLIMEQNIISGLDSLKAQTDLISEEVPSELDFAGKEIQLTQNTSKSMLPSVKVVNELMASTSQ